MTPEDIEWNKKLYDPKYWFNHVFMRWEYNPDGHPSSYANRFIAKGVIMETKQKEIKFLGLCLDCKNPVYDNEKYISQGSDGVVCHSCYFKGSGVEAEVKITACTKCTNCGIDLLGIWIWISNGEPYCEKCFHTICFVCGNTLDGDEFRAYYDGNPYCKKCDSKKKLNETDSSKPAKKEPDDEVDLTPKPDKFCCQCGTDLKGLYITTGEEGKFLCRKCGFVWDGICGGWKLPSGHVTHNHVSKECYICKKSVNKDKDTVIYYDGKPYCKDCNPTSESKGKLKDVFTLIKDSNEDREKCKVCGDFLSKKYMYDNKVGEYCVVCAPKDGVNHPSHYTQGKIEIIDFIEDQKLGYHDGNVIKYVCRAKHKGTMLKDLKKAQWYLQRYIKIVQDVENADVAAERGG